MASRNRSNNVLRDDEITEFLDDDESSFGESVGSDDFYVPPQDRRSNSTEGEGSNSSSIIVEPDPLAMEEIEPELSKNRMEAEVESELGSRNVEIEADAELITNNVEKEVELEISENTRGSDNTNIIWSPVHHETYRPRKSLSLPRTCRVSDAFIENIKPIEIFLKFFPKSLLAYIAQCTNLRIDKARIQVGDRDARARKRSYMTATDRGEIMIVLGCTLIMGYNKLPSFSDYWSSKPSLGNAVIKTAISRDRCKFLLGKLYFTNPEKPDDASKIYYVEDVMSCLKITFKNNREDSHIQSIDESMTKFKGRSSLKQYMPMKPTKRGIKMWVRADAITGYVYDMNIYAGRESSGHNLRTPEMTLGENVIRTLTSTITNPDTTICFDRFFTSVTLMNTLDFPSVGTCNVSRKNMPKIRPGQKLRQGEMAFVENGHGTIAVRWQDTKDVVLMSNCHGTEVTEVRRKLKSGVIVPVPAPEIVAFYRRAMGGVDRNDRMVGEHEFERKSTKWWKKVFYRLLKMAIVNSWVIYREKVNRKCPMKDFLVDLSQEMVEYGKENTNKVRRQSKASGPSRTGGVVADHLPIQSDKRKRR